MKKLLLILFTISSLSAFEAIPPIPTPTPITPQLYVVPAEMAAGGSTTLLIAGVPNQKIRMFQYSVSVSAGMFVFQDSTGEFRVTGQSTGASGYQEISPGADLFVTCTDDCVLTVCISAVIQ